MSDEKFEEFLQREAKAYNEPPASAPRDEMWSSIAAAREARLRGGTAGTRVVSLSTHGRSHGRSHGIRRYASWIGMAATLLIGVGIGRFMMQGTSAPGSEGLVVASTSGTVGPAASPTGAPNADAPNADAPGRDAASVSRSANEPVDATPAPRQVAGRNAPVVPTTTVANAPADRGNGTNGMNASNGTPTSPYSVASQRHLASAEALITVVTATSRDAMMDSLTIKWAREMLGSTRLLLDSPAGDDALRRRLLEDLETLLVQIVQRSGGVVDERDLIDRTLQRTQLLTRLRSNAAGT
jgi:hypothetical protein